MQDILGRIDISDLFFAVVIMVALYVIADGLSRLGFISGEYSRKTVHITVGVFSATFPLFMSRTEIFVFQGIFFVFIFAMGLVSDAVKTFRRLHDFRLGRMLADMFRRYEDVGRWTIGQFLYPLSLMLVVLFFNDLLIYSFSVLVLALADGFAAVFGKSFGKKRFYVPGGYKTFVGSSTFFVITLTLMCCYLILATEAGVIALFPAFAYAAFLTILEGGVAGGFDNLVVPLATAILLNTL